MGLVVVNSAALALGGAPPCLTDAWWPGGGLSGLGGLAAHSSEPQLY